MSAMAVTKIGGSEQARKRVLLVDDSETMLRSLKTLIGEEVDVITAASISEGRRILGDDRFDSVITDYDVGDGTGFDLIEFLKESGIEIPVILITAFGSKELAVKTLNYQIFGYLEKPFNPEELCRLLAEALVKRTKGESEKKLANLGLRSGELVHEIATPLTLIGLKTAELRELLGERAGDPKVSGALEMIDSQLSRIKKIVRESRERLKVQGADAAGSIPVQALLGLVQEQCEVKARQSGVALTVEWEPRLAIVGDRERLLQVFVNLISNAVDAVLELEERWVRLEARMEDEFVVFRVTDSGHGIPPEVQAKLFNLLFTTKKEKGTGLGLSIALRIVKEHQGEMFYNPGSRNTEFVVRLPMARKP